jgi:hypothetical protein
MFRNGQWVRLDGLIGIYMDGDVHLVDEKGETARIVKTPHPVRIDALLFHEDIPKPRRPKTPHRLYPSRDPSRRPPDKAPPRIKRGPRVTVFGVPVEDRGES